MDTQHIETTPRYWSFWATIALGLVIFCVFSLAQVVGLVGYIYLVDPQAISALFDPNSAMSADQLLSTYSFNGDAIAVSVIMSSVVCTALLIYLAWLRKPMTIDEYYDLNIPRLKSMLIFLGLMVLAMIAMESVNHVLDRPTPEFMTEVYANIHNLPLFWIAVSVAAPIFEEFFFRGFLLEGMSRSRLGLIGASIITSAAWAIIHLQYGWFEIISIFFIGILLCIAKVKSRSLYVPIAMHMLMNITASIVMEFTL